MIYFVQDPSDKTIKIGMANLVARRMKQLEARYGPLNLLGVHAGFRKMERCLHGIFDELRLGTSEWFHPGEKLLAYIVNRCHSWSPEDDIDAEYDRDAGIVYSGESLQWLLRFTEKMGFSDIAATIDAALAHYAEFRGFTEPYLLGKEKIALERPPCPGEPKLTESDDIGNSDCELVVVPSESFPSEWEWI